MLTAPVPPPTGLAISGESGRVGQLSSLFWRLQKLVELLPWWRASARHHRTLWDSTLRAPQLSRHLLRSARRYLPPAPPRRRAPSSRQALDAAQEHRSQHPRHHPHLHRHLLPSHHGFRQELFIHQRLESRLHQGHPAYVYLVHDKRLAWSSADHHQCVAGASSAPDFWTLG